MKLAKLSKILVIVVIFECCGLCKAEPMDMAFTYEGWLTDANGPMEGLYDFQFTLYDDPDPNFGMQIGYINEVNDLEVSNGCYAVYLDFSTGDPNLDSNIFNGDARWIEVACRAGELNDPNEYTILSPRLEILPVPYALYAKTAGSTTETDPTVPDSIKDGINWNEISDIPSDIIDGDDVGITSETDPTVLASVKDGVSWNEVSSRPAGLDDGDDVGITSESDPQVGSNTTGRIPKWNGSALVTGTIYDNGNVGIGTSNPQSKLSVGGGGIADAAVHGSGTLFGVVGRGSTLGVQGTDSDSDSYGRLGYGDWGGYFSGDGYFSGNVGIGTTNPVSKLSVGGGGIADAGVYGNGKYGVYGTGTSLGVYGRDSDSGSNGALGSDDKGVYGNGQYGVYGSCSGSSAGVHGEDSESGSYGRLGCGDYGGYFSGDGYFSGNVGIGGEPPAGYKLLVIGMAAKPGGGSWTNYSDARLKEIGDGYERGLPEIGRLNPVMYKYAQDNELELPTDEEYVGLIAQDVQGVIPEAVQENTDGYLMVNNDPIIWAMVNAIKELKAENDSLRQRIEALETSISQNQLAMLKEAENKIR
jgi:hypothetical protein